MDIFEEELWKYLCKKIKNATVRNEIHIEIIRKVKKYSRRGMINE